jgi:hypothetical protein
LPAGFAITDVKPFAKDTSLVSTSGNGLFLLTGNSIQPFSLQNTNSEQYFTAIDVLDKTNFLVGSYNSGLYKINRTGMVLDRISANNGLISNTIRCINTGFDGCTWIGLDNSIALTDWNNPIKHINPPSFNNGSGQGATVFNGDFYFALSTGLQWLPITNHSDLTKTALEPKTILNGLTWNISSWGNQLLSGVTMACGQFQIIRPPIFPIQRVFGTFNQLMVLTPNKLLVVIISGLNYLPTKMANC